MHVHYTYSADSPQTQPKLALWHYFPEHSRAGSSMTFFMKCHRIFFKKQLFPNSLLLTHVDIRRKHTQPIIVIQIISNLVTSEGIIMQQ